MASPQAEVHQAAQDALTERMARIMPSVWSLLDLDDLSHSLNRFVEALTAILSRYGLATTTAADMFYQSKRANVGAPGSMPHHRVKPISAADIDAVVVDSVATALTDGAQAGERSLDSEAEQLVLNQSRRQIMTTAQLDRAAKGWARVVEPGACSFCLMLAMKGPFYNSKRTANFRAHTKKPDGSGGDCKCHAEPVFGQWEPQAVVRDAQALWESINGKGKRSGHDARVAFRQALEGRKVTGARTNGPDGKPRPLPAGKDRQGRPYSLVTPERTRKFEQNQLRVLSALPPAKTPAAAKWRADRIESARKWLADHPE